MATSPCCKKTNARKGIWAEEEDAISNSGAISKKAGQSSKLRWTNYHECSEERFTPQEEELIIRLHATIGSRWTIIAQQLPGKTDIDVKNHWNTKLRKKLSGMGIDPVTHKPFSKILADYGNISSLPGSTSARIGSLNRDLKNIIAFESQLENYSNYNTNLKGPLSVMPKMEPIQNSFSVTTTTTIEDGLNHNNTFSWRDYLLEDAFLPENTCANDKESSGSVEEINNDNSNNNIPVFNSFSDSTSSDSSFVEAIIDGEKDRFLEFPGLLDEPFF